MGNLIGVDLGTWRSCVVVLERATPTVIPDREGARVIPSVVAFPDQGPPIVGRAARRQAPRNPARTIQGVKRLLGRRFDSKEARTARAFQPYPIVEAANHFAHIRIDDRSFSPSEIAAVLLSTLKAAAEDYLDEPVEEAVLSVPAYFNDSQRQAMKDAGTIAGLKVERILNEATAAALAYGATERRTGRIAVYDLGGGTFDVSIVELNQGVYRVLATGGDTYLGGEDFDELIMKWLAEKFRNEHGVDFEGDSGARQRLKDAAEGAKRRLSTEPWTEVLVPFAATDETGPKHMDAVLTRSAFEQMIAPMLQHTVELCRRTLADAGLGPDDLDDVVAVGGQTRTPAVWRTIREAFGKDPRRTVNPDEAVAFGTAIQTGILRDGASELVLLDVTPHTLGIEARREEFAPLVRRNARIPTKASRPVTTAVDDQTTVEVHALQGEGATIEENDTLGRFVLRDLPRAPAGQCRVDVTFEIDADGIVHVGARDRASGRGQRIKVRGASGLTRSELDTARTQNERWACAARELAERERVARRLRGLVVSTRRSLELVADRLPEPERTTVVRALVRAETAAEAPLVEARQALDELSRIAERLGQAMLDAEALTSRATIEP